MKKVVPIIIFLCISVLAHAQENICRSMNALRVTTAPVIDGVPDDSCWKNAEIAADFVQFQPHPDTSSREKTEVKIVYNNDGIYVLARMYDHSPDSILHQLGPRDEFQNNADAFAIFLDTYHDGRNAFFFGVTAAGVQTDARYTVDKGDLSLNAVWYSKAVINKEGWCVEMKIPFQAIRFPNKEVQEWGLNFERVIRRYREISYWNRVDPNTLGVINQCGVLKGLENIISPVRLALLPYVSGYVENYNGSTGFSANGGMDIKYGINESFTLDMTLIPDFGQTLSDNLVLNLSPVEVKFDERRYFFTEGTELFNKNDLFYSRRIGGKPVNYNSVSSQLDSNEVISDNPSDTRLYNAVKISGRTPSKLGVGFLNAISAPSFATVTDTLEHTSRRIETNPLTNYNVLVIDKILKNNSYIGFLNTGVLREGNARDADVSSVQFRAGDKKNKYAIEGFGDMSNIFISGNSASTGYRYNITAGKVSGKYTAMARYKVVSDKFDPNDLGYLDRNNVVDYGISQSYNIFKPFGHFIFMLNNVDLDLGSLFIPRHYTFFTITGKHIFTFRNWFTCGVNWLADPIISYDYFETRVPGRYLIYPKNYQLGGFISSDYRKKFALDGGINYRIFLERNRTIFNYNLAPRWRVNDKLFIVYKWEQELKHDNVGYVAYRNDSLFFGVRDLNTITNTVTLNYIFTNKMGLTLRVRHYWSQADYKSYFLLNDAGKVEDAYYNGNSDVSFNAFNIDMIFTWQFLPGSEVSVVWKNAILTQDNLLKANYIEDSKYIFNSPQNNSFSAKVIWYIDAGKWFAKDSSFRRRDQKF
ncbi:MAG: carbohydrate binding family 9 domain-containing protein [Bacteroidetes bacterium]|nr:carbohydrate binding family 9 domain-containing protein [Bacteroidota bacterium]